MYPTGRQLIIKEGQIIGASDGDIYFVETEKTVADNILIKYHYSKKVTKNTFCSLLINDGNGAIQLGYGIRPKNKGELKSLLGDNNWCEFDRMWLSDVMPKFSESRVIGLLIFFIKHRFPNLEYIITYADESAGNKGIIYQATNAFELEGKKVDFYLLPSGERIHPVTMWHRHKTRAFKVMQEIYPGIIHICGNKVKGTEDQELINKYKNLKQRKYLYPLNKRARKNIINYINLKNT